MPDLPIKTLPPERRVRNFQEVSGGLTKRSALEEGRRCPQCTEPPCAAACPLGIDIPGFIRLLREGEAAAALDRIREANVFPGVCGRICPAPCETACVLGTESATIPVRALERYAADHGRRKLEVMRTGPAHRGAQVAVIGAGPAGLAAAAALARHGVRPVVFEAMPQAGGILRYGIPEFRLPRKVLDREIHDIVKTGVEIRTNVPVGRMGTVRELLDKDFAAVLLTAGTGEPGFSDLPGAELGGVYYREEFLLAAHQLSPSSRRKQFPLTLGSQVVVAGPGPGALDCARSVRRMGLRVTMMTETLPEDIRGHGDDLAQAREEGVILEGPVRVRAFRGDEAGWVKSVEGSRLDFADPDDSGHWQLIEVPESEFATAADAVIIAGLPRPGRGQKKLLPELEWSEDGRVILDDGTGMTSVRGVFAAGTLVVGSGALVDAIASGKRAAGQIAKYLGREGKDGEK